MPDHVELDSYIERMVTEDVESDDSALEAVEPPEPQEGPQQLVESDQESS